MLTLSLGPGETAVAHSTGDAMIARIAICEYDSDGADGVGSALLVGCAWFGGQSKPDWIDGVSAAYPSAQYLVGVGQADNRAAAEDRAYAAVARIFKAEVNAQAKDWESYLVIEQRGQSSDERRLTLDNLTRVSTDKVLENVQIVDRWVRCG